MKGLALFTVLVAGGLLVWGTTDFPAFGNPASPPSVHVSPHYIEHAMEETDVPNIVTAVLADYRGYDTMFETTVVFTAAVACFFLLRLLRREETEDARFYRHISTGITFRIRKGGRFPEGSAEFERIDSQWVPYDVILRTTTRLIIPFIQLFALYVIGHGHHSPGGGFQGGVILGASIILYALSQNLRRSLERMGERVSAFLCAAGVFLYAGTGALCLLLGAVFLDYAGLTPVFRVDPVYARSLGILVVEIGVGLSVMAAMVWIYYNVASAGKHDEGL